jgi:cephalosporin hydroxylase
MADLPTNLDVEASYATFDHPDGYTQHHRGIPVWKTVDDMVRYRTVVEATRPDVVVECGTRWGGFAAWLADQFGVHVVTVDLHRHPDRPGSWPGVTFLEGNSLTLPGQVRALVAGRRTMVTLDSDHHAPHVAAEIRAYGPLVTPGCYLVVEDGLADLLDPLRAVRFGYHVPDVGGPLHAIAQTLADDPGWLRDQAVEDMSPVSHHPAGWWLRRA